MKCTVQRLVEVVQLSPPTYVLVLHQKPSVEGSPHGKAYLKAFHYHVYERYCSNLKTV
jgi:hypothetical protein